MVMTESVTIMHNKPWSKVMMMTKSMEKRKTWVNVYHHRRAAGESWETVSGVLGIHISVVHAAVFLHGGVSAPEFGGALRECGPAPCLKFMLSSSGLERVVWVKDEPFYIN